MTAPITPSINPNISLQAEAVAGNSSIIFSAADRKILRDRTGKEDVDRARSFLEVFTRRDISPKVENEQTTIKPEQDVRILEQRQREHREILKNSLIKTPHDKATVKEEDEDQSEKPSETVEVGKKPPVIKSDNKVEIRPETAALAKQLNLNAADLFEKLALEQDDLHSLIYKIKELHFKRLLCTSKKEFIELSQEITRQTLSSAKHEAQAWIEEQLSKLAGEAIQYKLNLIKSMQSISYDKEQEKSRDWLQELTVELK